MLDVALLGTGGMMPLPNRYLTSMLLRHNGGMILTDCGEGTQVTLKLLGWGFKSIDAICFTHFHADHISGLVGMLLTIGNSGRTEPLVLSGPYGLKHVVDSLRVIAPNLPFSIAYNEYAKADKHVSFSLGAINVNACEVEHRVRCYAYSFDVPRRGKFDLERAMALNIPKQLWSQLQKNDVVEYDGVTYYSHMVLGEQRRGLKVSYCTDCRPSASISGLAQGSDLFICEGMYYEGDKLSKAKEYKHMIFSEAAQLAVAAGGVGELWLTHFSPSMTRPEDGLDNAKTIFHNTIIGRDRMTKTLIFEQ